MIRQTMRLAWKEYRQLRPAWIALLLLGLLLVGIGAAGSGPGTGWGQDAALIVAGLFALAGGAMLVAGEREAGTDVFLDMLPTHSLRISAAKTGVIVIGSVILALILSWFAAFVPWLIARLFEDAVVRSDAKPLRTVVAAWGPWTIAVFAWSVLISTYRKRVAETALIGGACAAVSDYYLSSLFAPHPAVDLFYSVENMADRWWLRLVVAFGVAAVAVYRLATVPSIWTAEPSARRKSRTAHARGWVGHAVDRAALLPMRLLPQRLFPVGSPQRALVWQQCRRSRATYLAAAAVPLVFATMLAWAGVHSNPQVVIGANMILVIFYAVSAAAMLGVDVFRHDNAEDSARFLRDRGVCGRTVFWTRLLPNSIVLVFAAVLTLGVLIAFDRLVMSNDGAGKYLVFSVPTVFACAAIPFAAGMLFGQWLRRPLLAVTGGIFAGVIAMFFSLAIWASSANWPRELLWLYAYPLVVAAAMAFETWAYADAWLERRRFGRLWRWAASPTLWALLVVPIAGTQYEIAKLPPSSLKAASRGTPWLIDWNSVWSDELFHNFSAETEEAAETYFAYVDVVRSLVPREVFTRQMKEEGISPPERTPGKDDDPEYLTQVAAYEQELNRRWLAANRKAVEQLTTLANRPYLDILPLVAEWGSRERKRFSLGGRAIALPDPSDEKAVAAFRKEITWNDFESRRLVRLLCFDADRLIAEGDLDAAWERILAAQTTSVRIGTTYPRSIYTDNRAMITVAGTVDHWISAEGQTPQRLREAVATWKQHAVPYRRTVAYRAFIAAKARYRHDVAKCVFGMQDVPKALDIVLRATRIREWEDRAIGRLADREFAMAGYLHDWEDGRHAIPPPVVTRRSLWEDRFHFSTVIYGDDFWSWPLENGPRYSHETERLTLLKLALAVYFAEHGRWPSRLDDLQGEVLEDLPAPVYPYTEYHYYPHGRSPVSGKSTSDTPDDVPCISLGRPRVFTDGRFYTLGTDGRWREAKSVTIGHPVFAVTPGCAAEKEPKESAEAPADTATIHE